MACHQRHAACVDLTKAFSARIWAVDHGINGHFQAALLKLNVDDAIAAFHVLNGHFRLGHHVFCAFGERCQEGLHSSWILFDQLRAGDNDIAIQLDAIAGIRQHHDIFCFHATCFKVEQRGERKSCDGINFAAGEHRFAQRWIHRDPRHSAHIIGFLEDRKSAATGIKHWRTEFLADEISWLADAAFLQAKHSSGCIVVHHHHGYGLVGRVRVIGMEFHEGGHVSKAHLIGTRGHALHSCARARARIQADIQLDIFEVAFSNRRKEQGGWALKAPVENEFDRGQGLRKGACDQNRGSGYACGGESFEGRTLVHESSEKVKKEN